MAVAYVDGGTGIGVGGGSAVTFTTGAPAQVDSDIAVLVDFDNDGDFSEPIEDITGYVLSAEASIGRDFPSQVGGKASPGQLSLTLDNTDGRFSFFNKHSPLNTSPYSLMTGRKVRIRDANASDADPAKLAYDSFDRVTGAEDLGTTNTGQLWQQVGANGFQIGKGRAVTVDGGTHLAVIDVGATDYFAQVRVMQTGMSTSGIANSTFGLVYRYQDPDDYSKLQVDLNARTISLVNVVAGVSTTVTSALLEVVDGVTVAVQVVGTSVVGFLDGVVTLQGTAIQTDETEVGIFAVQGATNLQIQLDDFEVYTPISTAQYGWLGAVWTGNITEIVPEVDSSRRRTCTIRAEGVLAKLAGQDIPSPRYVVGQGTGYLVGRVLNEARLLSPPVRLGAIQPGTRATGPVTFDEDRVPVLEAARRFEDHEVGFLHEVPEGGLQYSAWKHRDILTASKAPQATFSDDPGTQFGYSAIELLDWSRELVNRVEGGVAPKAPVAGTTLGSTVSTAVGTAANLTFTIPTDVGHGELLIFVVASTVAASASADWPVPIWWVPERRDIQDNGRGLRIFTHVSDGTDGGDVVTFYSDTGSAGGSHVWFSYRFPPGQWFGTHEGIAVSDFRRNSTPPVADPPWGALPTWYLAIRAGTIGTGAGGAVGATSAPVGFLGLNSEFVNGSGTNSFDNVLQTAQRIDTRGVIEPTAWSASLSGFILNETVVVMVRGYNGRPPVPSGVARSVVDHPVSQQSHNRVATYKAASDLFRDDQQVEQFAADVFDLYAEDRPFLRISFPATKDSQHRAQAIARRVNDRITLVADNDAGQGVLADFYIERVEHTWSDGGKHWLTAWDLSPAPARTVDGPV